MNTNLFFNIVEKLKQLKIFKIALLMPLNFCSVYLLCAALSELMLVLHKGALFH
jgi:hypothetical protein